MFRWELLNLLAFKYRYSSYLEIGTQNANVNFHKIICHDKISVDPNPVFDIHYRMTSDDFFASIPHTMMFDLIFIDGLHIHEQVLKDIDNSLQHLLPNGSIVIHDCLPTKESMQVREEHLDEWTGDVWKAIAILRMTRPNLNIRTYDMDYGCALIKRGSQNLFPKYGELNWDFFKNNYKQLMNVVPAPDLSLLNI